jgi:PAS domain S-box-containing protein
MGAYREAAAEWKAKSDKPITVLLIEDDPGDADLLREMLCEGRVGSFDLVHTERLSAGLERLAAGNVDVVLLDLCLPDSQGYDTVDRARMYAPKVPIVVLTALGDQAVAIKAVREGVQDYLVKGSMNGYMLARTMRYAIERKRAEEALRQSQQKYEQLIRQNELILNSAGEGICGLDRQGNITFVNPAAARMIGWEMEELIGLPMHAILHHSKPDGTPYPKAECPTYAAFKDGGVVRMDTEVFWRKDDTSFPVEYISTPIRERGKFVGAVVTFKDITVERQTERLAMLGRVAAGVAHELNNALGVVLASSQLLLKRADSHSETYHDLELIEKYAGACGRIVHDLRLLGRPLPLKRKLVELHPLIEETLKRLEPTLTSRKIQVKMVVTPHLRPLSADPRLLGQALLNLTTNAAEAMPDGGTLTLAARAREKMLYEIAISDTGVGIARKHFNRIFEPFFTIKSTGEGMGLGLTITSRIVQDHGGRLEVTSKVGRGSTFRVLLPLVEIRDPTSPPLDR